jgi:hypothetical protein
LYERSLRRGKYYLLSVNSNNLRDRKKIDDTIIETDEISSFLSER